MKSGNILRCLVFRWVIIHVIHQDAFKKWFCFLVLFMMPGLLSIRSQAQWFYFWMECTFHSKRFIDFNHLIIKETRVWNVIKYHSCCRREPLTLDKGLKKFDESYIKISNILTISLPRSNNFNVSFRTPLFRRRRGYTNGGGLHLEARERGRLDSSFIRPGESDHNFAVSSSDGDRMWQIRSLSITRINELFTAWWFRTLQLFAFSNLYIMFAENFRQALYIEITLLDECLS